MKQYMQTNCCQTTSNILIFQISTRYEIFYEKDKEPKSLKEREKYIFGELSDSDDSSKKSSSSEVGENVIMDFTR